MLGVTLCFFVTQVLNAQAAGFSMVVVYDHQQRNLFKMSRSTSKGSHHPDVEIPLVSAFEMCK